MLCSTNALLRGATRLPRTSARLPTRAAPRPCPGPVRAASSLRFGALRTLPTSASAPPLRALRTYATTSAPPPPASGGASYWGLAALAAALGAGVFYRNEVQIALEDAGLLTATPLDYQAVYNEIANLLESKPDYDDGSYGPVLVRLAWHAAGTYDKATNTGGSDGATMRHSSESNHGANKGLDVARTLLEQVKSKFPRITYSDLWSLGGVCAIQEAGGPIVPWRPGRRDADATKCTPDGRLPDASKGASHLRDIFYRMGFDDREIVALSGAHALGRCHADRSGFDGPWTFSPVTFSNQYFALLLSESWDKRKWTGPVQLQDRKTGTLMMLPTDYELVKDSQFKKWVKAYAADDKLFFKDFAEAFKKLLELGVPFKADSKTLSLKPLP